MSVTTLLRKYFVQRAMRTDDWAHRLQALQLQQLRWLLKRAQQTEFGRQHGFTDILHSSDIYAAYRAAVKRCEFESIRDAVRRMIQGVPDVLWPGVCRDYAQSSGTSGGKSKYIPITADSLRYNHYAGGKDAVAYYLRLVPESRLFDGKALILGGSFANEIENLPPRVHVGDLSATLIRKINPLAGMVRVPSRKIALMPDWTRKLPLMTQRASAAKCLTNISGVPSWMLVLMRNILSHTGLENLKEVWPGLEVFFHGGISFDPYRDEYERIGTKNLRFIENYNASEGFFAVQNDFDDRAMLLLIDAGIFFEFMPLDGTEPLPAWEVIEGKTYELIITVCNGLWRYSPGDTVLICNTKPLKIKVAGRTHSYLNAFGEELMGHNAEAAITEACRSTGAVIADYTAAPIYASDVKKGAHQWLIEWIKKPASIEEFAQILDNALQRLNSDYQAKRSGDIFLGAPEITSLSEGTFDHWLASVGNGKLGGQRKVPRLCNDRHIVEAILGSKS